MHADHVFLSCGFCQWSSQEVGLVGTAADVAEGLAVETAPPPVTRAQRSGAGTLVRWRS